MGPFIKHVMPGHQLFAIAHHFTMAGGKNKNPQKNGSPKVAATAAAKSHPKTKRTRAIRLIQQWKRNIGRAAQSHPRRQM